QVGWQRRARRRVDFFRFGAEGWLGRRSALIFLKEHIYASLSRDSVRQAWLVLPVASAFLFRAVAHKQSDRGNQLINGLTIEYRIGAGFGVVGMFACGFQVLVYC